MIFDPYLKLMRSHARQDKRVRAVNGFDWDGLQELEDACDLIISDESAQEATVYDGLFLQDMEIESLRLREDAMQRIDDLGELLAYGRALNKVLVQFEVIQANQKACEEQLTEVK